MEENETIYIDVNYPKNSQNLNESVCTTNLNEFEKCNENNTPPSTSETILKFHLNEIEKEKIKKIQRNISPDIKRTPNTKAEYIISKIYSNRKNVIKYSKKDSESYNENFISKINSNTFSDSDNELNSSKNLSQDFSQKIKNKNDNIHSNQIYSISNNSVNHMKTYSDVQVRPNYSKSNRNLYDSKNINNYDNINEFQSIIHNTENKLSSIKDELIETSQNQDIPRKEILSKPYFKSISFNDVSDESNSKDSNESTESTSPDTELSNETKYRTIKTSNKDKKKRKYYKHNKQEIIKPLENIEKHLNIIANTKNNSNFNTPNPSPREESVELWNDSIENYYIEFQKICKDEVLKYKYLSHRNEILSNILKFILVISSCFTFTLSISNPSSLFLSTTTTISSCLTTIITTLQAFFQFDKKSEIQNYIYKELDKVINSVSLELLKPTNIRSDPYELILSLQNRRDELLKSLRSNKK